MQEIERRNPLLARVASGRGSYYQPTPLVNLNPDSVQFVQGIPTQVGNFFARNAAANNAWRYQNPQYQSVPLSSYGNQSMIPLEAQQQGSAYLAPALATASGLAGYGVSQLGQNANMRLGLGASPATAIAPVVGMAASKLPYNVVNGIANSPVGRWGAKVIDWIF